MRKGASDALDRFRGKAAWRDMDVCTRRLLQTSRALIVPVPYLPAKKRSGRSSIVDQLHRRYQATTRGVPAWR
jgi:hypothetical protein